MIVTDAEDMEETLCADQEMEARRAEPTVDGFNQVPDANDHSIKSSAFQINPSIASDPSRSRKCGLDSELSGSEEYAGQRRLCGTAFTDEASSDTDRRMRQW